MAEVATARSDEPIAGEEQAARLHLHPRCHLVPLDQGLLLRAGEATRCVREPARAELVRRVLPLVDGRRASELLAAVDGRDKILALRLVQELIAAGIIVGDVGESFRPLPPAPPTVLGAELAARRLLVLGAGVAAEEATRELRVAGARQVSRLAPDALGSADLHAHDLCLVLPQGPQLALLERFNRHATPIGLPWVWGIALDDHAVLGTMGHPDRPGCFRCFELRWLGMAEDIGAESAFFEHLRRDGWKRELPAAAACARWIARAAARAALSSLTVEGAPARNIQFVHLHKDQARARRLHAHPLCEVCRADAATPAARDLPLALRSDDPPPPSAMLLLQLGDLDDDRIGIVGRVSVRSLAAAGGDAPPLARANARFAIPDPDPRAGLSNAWSQSCAPDPSTARLIALAEALERYCGIRPPPADTVDACYREVAGRAVCPTELPLYSERQYATPGFPFERFSPDMKLRWRRGYSLTRQTSRLVPEIAVSYGTRRAQLFDECSSGMAAHGSLAEATLRALLELVERDAFMITWLNQLSPPLIDLSDDDDPYCRAALNEISERGYEPYLVDLTTDLGIPVTLALMIRRNGDGPALICGAAADLSARRATRRALLEAHGAFREALVTSWRPGRIYRDDEIVGLEDHGLAYAHPSWLGRAEFLWSSSLRRTLPGSDDDGDGRPSDASAVAGLDWLVERLRGQGLEVIAVDMTAPELAGTSLAVARVLVPGLQPIGFGTNGIRLGGERLYRAPVRMGYRATPAREDELNRTPHCFP